MTRDSRLDLMKSHSPGLSSLWGLIDLEVGEERGCFLLKDAKAGDRHPPNLQLGAFPEAELQHRAPGTDICTSDDLHLGGVGEDAACRFAGQLPAVDPVFD